MFCSMTRGADRIICATCDTGAAIGTTDDDADAVDDGGDGVGMPATDRISEAATAAAPSCNFRRLNTVFAASTTGFPD